MGHPARHEGVRATLFQQPHPDAAPAHHHDAATTPRELLSSEGVALTVLAMYSVMHRGSPPSKRCRFLVARIGWSRKSGAVSAWTPVGVAILINTDFIVQK